VLEHCQEQARRQRELGCRALHDTTRRNRSRSPCSMATIAATAASRVSKLQQRGWCGIVRLSTDPDLQWKPEPRRERCAQFNECAAPPLVCAGVEQTIVRGTNS
jgi:hypothetical protein